MFQRLSLRCVNYTFRNMLITASGKKHDISSSKKRWIINLYLRLSWRCIKFCLAGTSFPTGESVHEVAIIAFIWAELQWSITRLHIHLSINTYIKDANFFQIIYKLHAYTVQCACICPCVVLCTYVQFVHEVRELSLCQLMWRWASLWLSIYTHPHTDTKTYLHTDTHAHIRHKARSYIEVYGSVR